MKMVVDMMIEAYIKVEGEDKWNSLTAEQQHDVVMTLVKDATRAMSIAEQMA